MYKLTQTKSGAYTARKNGKVIFKGVLFPKSNLKELQESANSFRGKNLKEYLTNEYNKKYSINDIKNIVDIGDINDIDGIDVIIEEPVKKSCSDRKIYMDLIGSDGESFSLMGKFRKEAIKQGMPMNEINCILDECKSGDYNHLIQTLIKYTCTDKSVLKTKKETIKEHAIPKDYELTLTNGKRYVTGNTGNAIDNLQMLFDEIYEGWDSGDSYKDTLARVLKDYGTFGVFLLQYKNMNYQVGNGGFAQYLYNNYYREVDTDEDSLCFHDEYMMKYFPNVLSEAEILFKDHNRKEEFMNALNECYKINNKLVYEIDNEEDIEEEYEDDDGYIYTEMESNQSFGDILNGYEHLALEKRWSAISEVALEALGRMIEIKFGR